MSQQVSQKQKATQKQITVVNINTQRAAQRRRRYAVSVPPPPVFRGGYQPPPPPPIIPLPPPPDLYESNRLRERVDKLERLNVVNMLPFKKPVKSVETQTSGIAVRDRTAGRRTRIEAAADELLNPTTPIELVGSEAFAKDKERERQRKVELVDKRIVDIDEETGGVIRPPSPPPPEEVAPPSESSRDSLFDIRGSERIGTERIVGDHRGSMRALRERMRTRPPPPPLAAPDPLSPPTGLSRATTEEAGNEPMGLGLGGGIDRFWGRVARDVERRQGGKTI